MIDFSFEPDPAGNKPGTRFYAWRTNEGRAARFQVGMRTYFKKQDRWGLAFYGDEKHDPAYRASDYPALGAWAHLLDVTIAGEGRGRFTTLNTWDRAAFTFGFLQFAAHVADGDFVQWFRAMLARPEATDYFPGLKLVDGWIADTSGPLESASSTSRLMAYLNPNGDRVDADEVLNAARLIDWTRRYPDTREKQVAIGAQSFHKILRNAARNVPLDGESDAVCAVVADIRHQGRGGKKVWPTIRQALAAADKLDALLGIGADEYGERCRAVGKAIHGKLVAGTLGGTVYRSTSGEFTPRASFAPSIAAGAESTTPAAGRGDQADQGAWVAFDSAPFAAGQPPGNRVLVEIPPDFRPAAPFVVTLFLAGHDLASPCSQLDQINMIPDQVRASSTNAILLAPRLGPKSQSGRFDRPRALAEFIDEASRKVEQLLVASGSSGEDAAQARGYMARSAPIVIVSFSGGCHTLRHLLINEQRMPNPIDGVLLLDSIYDPQPEQAIAEWATKAVGRSWLVSLHGSSTTNRNKVIMGALKAARIPFSHGVDWTTKAAALLPGTMAFSPARGHCEIPTHGPPLLPVKAMLDRLDARYAKVSHQPVV